MNPLVLGMTIGGLHVGDIVVTLLSISILLFLLKKFAWGPLINVMAEREHFVATEVESADEKRIQAEELLKEANERIETAQKEAKAIIVNARQRATAIEEETIKEARFVARKMKQDAEDEIEIERKEVLLDMQEEVTRIALQIATEMIQKEMSTEEQKKLIEERLQNIGDDWS